MLGGGLYILIDFIIMRIRLFTFQLLAVMGAFCAPIVSAQTVLNDSIPEHWSYNEHFNQSVPTDDNWWSHFDDPVLDSLIAEGVENNYNVIMAARRINMARQSLNSVRAGYFPNIGLNVGWTKSRSSGAMGEVMTDAVVDDYFSLGLDMSWEIDVFGKIRAKAKQQKSAYDATRAEYAAVMTSLCANIAKNYIQLRVWQAEWQVAMEHIASQEKILKITEARHEAGLASMLDVTQAKIVYNSTKSSVPGLESAIHRTINGIAILLGVYPDSIYSRLEPSRKLPDYNQLVPVGVPAQLLRRRPDIVEAEAQLAGYAAALGVAKKDFLPTLTLNGSIGTSARRLDNTFKNNSLTYSIAPTLSWTVFDGLARKYNVASAREQMAIGIDNYNLTVMTAVEEVDNAISTYLSTLRKIEVLDTVVNDSRKSLDLSLDLYKRGLNPFNDVVTSQLNLLENTNSLVAAQGDAITALISLYSALGGGWSVDDMNGNN